MRVNERSSDVYSADIIFGAYSVATLKGGYKTFEILDRNDLADIKSAAKTKKVWDRWGGEMSKKSAVRRHRKTLPLGDRDLVINDSRSEEHTSVLQSLMRSSYDVFCLKHNKQR